jgi:NAD(P)-dependent dehydrogenase (short-subunit alcohol dehydrogenase family)
MPATRRLGPADDPVRLFRDPPHRRPDVAWHHGDSGGHRRIWVGRAPLRGGAPYGRWSDAGWDWTIDVNLKAVIWGVEIFGPVIEKHGEGGHIASTASIAGLVSSTTGAYSVTKYSVVALSEGLRNELGPRGIGVSVLCPGLVRTRIGDIVHIPGLHLHRR